jgi:hypothetical protein
MKTEKSFSNISPAFTKKQLNLIVGGDDTQEACLCPVRPSQQMAMTDKQQAQTIQ